VSESKLFRDEVLQAQQSQWLGSIRIGQPLSFTLVTAVALALGLALVAYSVCGEISRKARLPGLLEPSGGLLNVAAPQAGVVAEVLVHEGDAVQAGQPLLRLKSERSIAAGDTAVLNARFLEQRRFTLQSERLLAQRQHQQRDEALRDRARSLEAEERQVVAEQDNVSARATLAQKTLERFAELARGGYVSDVQVQQRQEELLDVQLRLRNADRNLEAVQRNKRAVLAELADNRSQALAAESQFDRTLASLSQEAAEIEARGGLTLTSPRAGRVSAITQSMGQSVQVGQNLVSIAAQAGGAPNGQELRAYLYAPSRTAGFVRDGQQVWIRYAAYPYQKFGMAEGQVVSVSRTPLAAQDLPSGQAQALMGAVHSNEPLYRIQVRLSRQDIVTYGKPQVLKAGMALEADVVQDRRAIWEWLFEPILATTRKST
jgi:membrane fusion protein